jgi:D-3-phosphoglycerate dehydrogenase
VRRADFITLHTPLTDKTRNIINAETLADQKGVRLINCARGGLVDEAALFEALKSGRVAGAALDVFARSRRRTARCSLPNVVCTPHLGASTMEAQENVALQIAEQMSDYLLRGAISNAVNFPSISAEEAPKLKPFVALAEKLGSFAGQLTETGIKRGADLLRGRRRADEHQGADLGGDRRPPAPHAAGRQRGLGADRRQGSRHRRRGDAARRRGRLREPDHRHGDHRPPVAASSPARSTPTAARASSTSRASAWTPSSVPSMIYITNLDKPGFIGKFSSTLGGCRHQHRDLPCRPRGAGGNAIALIEIDGELPADVLAKVRALPQVQQAKPLRF